MTVSAFHFLISHTRRHHGGGNSGGASDSVLAVLRDPPKKVPSRLEPEEEVPSVEVRWRVPSQASLAPTLCGDIERFYLKAWCRGKGKEVIRTKTSTVNVPRRDFCRNQVNQRFGRPRKSLSIAKGIFVRGSASLLPVLIPKILNLTLSTAFVHSTRIYPQQHIPRTRIFPSSRKFGTR